MVNINTTISGNVEKLITVGQINGNFVNNGVIYLIASHELFRVDNASDLTSEEFVVYANRYFVALEAKFGAFELIGCERSVKFEDYYIPPHLKNAATGEIIELDKNGAALADLLGNTQQLYLQGPPGSGKSILLRYIMAKIQELTIKCIPVYISLNTFKASCKVDSSYTLQDYITRDLATYGFPKAFIRYILTNGLALLLMDGLDEIYVKEEEKYFINSQIEDFKKLHIAKIVLTSRSKDYNFSDKNLVYFELLPFTKAMVEDYMAKAIADELKSDFFTKLDLFYNFTFDSRNASDNPSKEWADDRVSSQGGKLLTKEISDVILRAKPLPEVVSNPLLLSLLIFNYRQAKILPGSKNEIFSSFVYFLIDKWLQSYNSEFLKNRITSEEALHMLYYLAYRSFIAGNVMITRSALFLMIKNYLDDVLPEKRINADDIIKTFRTDLGLLTDDNNDVYKFIHPQLQEYLAAQFLSLGDNFKMIFEGQLFLKKEWSSILLLLTELLAGNDQYKRLYFSATATVLNFSTAVRSRVKWAVAKSSQNDEKQGIFLIFYYLGISLYYNIGERPIYALMRLAHKILYRLTNFQSAYVFSLYTFMGEVNYISKKFHKEAMHQDAVLLVLYDSFTSTAKRLKTTDEALRLLGELNYPEQHPEINRLKAEIVAANNEAITKQLIQLLKAKNIDLYDRLEIEEVNILGAWIDLVEIYLEGVPGFGKSAIEYDGFFSDEIVLSLSESSFPDILTSSDYAELAELIYKTSKPTAIGYLSKAINLNPSKGDYYLTRGAMMSQNGEHANAVLDFLSAQTLRKEFRSDFNFLNTFGNLYKRLDDYDHALECYQDATLISSADQISSRWFQVEIFMKTRRYKQALTLIEELQKLSPKELQFYYCAAYYHLLLDQFDHALYHLKKLIGNKYYLKESYFLETYCNLKTGHYEKVTKRIKDQKLLSGELDYIFYPLQLNCYRIQQQTNHFETLLAKIYQKGLISKSNAVILAPVSPGHIEMKRFHESFYVEDFRLEFDPTSQLFVKLPD